VVCLSVVCHIYAPCLNRSTDLDAIWQVHLWGLVTHFVRWGPWPGVQSKGRFGDQTSSQNMQLQIDAAIWQIETKSDSAFCQLPLVLVFVRVIYQLYFDPMRYTKLTLF